MSIADCSTIQPNLFGSPSKTLLSQSSYSSGDTGDFMCEASEQCSYYRNPFSIIPSGNIASEDEISVSFGSHCLIDLREGGTKEGQSSQSDNSSMSDEEQTRKMGRMRRQRKIASFGENVIQVQCSGDEVLTPPPVVSESDRQPRAVVPPPAPTSARDGEAAPGNNSQDESSSPETPRRRARRHAIATCPPNPIDIQQLSERRVSQDDDFAKEETVSTPRQRKTYSIEARLQNPLNIQLQLEDTMAMLQDVEESTPCGVEEEAVPVISQPDLEFDDDTLDMCPNPPTSPHLPGGVFFGGNRVDLPGSSVSVVYNHQSGLDEIRENGSGFQGTGLVTDEEEEEEGVVDGNSSKDAVIENLLTQYPHLSTYSHSSLLAISSFATRKMSDSALITQKNNSTNAHPRQRHRCVSDSAAPHIIIDDKSSEIGSWGHNYCDSGYDEKSSRCHGSSSSAYIASPRVSLYSSDLLSQEEGLDGGSSHSYPYSKPHRRLTPYMSGTGNIVGYSGSGQTKEDLVTSSQEADLGGQCQVTSSPSGVVTGTMVRPRERSRRSQIKNYSQSSLGASSVGTGASSETISLTSLFETPSPLTVEDLLSNLGFDDFTSPQLIPDRFIPKEIEHAKPSIMRTMTVSEYISHDSPSNSHHSSYEPSIASTSYSAPLPYSHHHISHSQHHQYHSSSSASLPGAYTYTGATPEAKTEETAPASRSYNNVNDSSTSDLPLGATAENFLAPRSSSPPPPAQSSQQPPEREIQTRNTDNRFLNNNVMTGGLGFHRGRLETVPEETASDLSPSPRWLSPRVSIDHSVNFDVAEGKLGASLSVQQKVRKRSLPTQREGYRLSVGSLVESDTGGDSIHFSVTSYDDEIAAEREKEREDTLPHLSLEDISIHQQRRRRRGVYTPPPALLTWLTQQQPIHEEDVGDPDELPWPFNEQARLRKSLTEIQLAQMALDGSTEIPSESRDLAVESQFSGSSKAEGCSSISSSPPSSIPRSSPGPGEEDNQDTQEDVVPATPRLSNNLCPLRRRHSRDNSTSSLRANHKTRSLSCQSDYHILRKHLEIPPTQFTNTSSVSRGGEQDCLLRTEMIEELRYTMSTSQRSLSRALAMKGDQCRQLQEVANQT